MPQVRIRIDKDGKATMEGVGFQGPICEKTLGEYLTAFGRSHEDVQRELKPEHDMVYVENTTG